MNKGIGLFVGMTALFAMGSAHAVCPGTQEMVYTDINDATGHVFEVYKAGGISWVDAADCADQHLGGDTNAVKGHLATITSSSENNWIIDDLLSHALPLTFASTPTSRTQVWVGGEQDASAAGVGDGWRWVNSEGPFSGSNGNPDYTNWADASNSTYAEPNDGDGSENGQENHLAVGRYPENLYIWNDEGAAPTSIGGFIVEYDVPRTAQCSGNTGPAGTDCNTIDGQKLVFPPGSFDPGETIQFTAYEFTDPRVAAGTCGIASLPPLFTDPVFDAPDDGNPATDERRWLKIPPYLCGSPKFVVVKVNSEDLSILRGAVLVVNNTEVVLPGNLYKCSDPILGNPDTAAPYSPDPQYQDVVVWQSTDPTKMFEDSEGAGIYDGAATEATNGCGSTVAKVRGASYFVVGLHIDFNLGSPYPANKAQNYAQFVALTKYKLTLLQKSVAEARVVGAIRNPDAQSMTSQLSSAVSKLNANNPAAALTYINKFIARVNTAQYLFPTGVTFNYNGDHLMRGENIRFTLRVKVIPYK